ncbi:molybdenum ABC transporter molybdate-binding protein [Cytobacillus oceanisediminis]|uniref:Carnitine transport ATP-binding protein OpuCA n=1 Tax=Cytobacillus oceanisediminis TaxID=665099 RepID=A0A2V2ZJX8_9BACI|nr:molybdate ABC transporter substrate-binding protein [Cytobacillus oceanisediminis]PWW20239.1 molybdenum ABC transporter molybdate-binding protein [Cytobacillus oceanisediminis]
MLNLKLKKGLRHFSVDISQKISNETLVLIGHSGCGKSTTLKMLAGLLSPDEGKIELKDHVIYDNQKKINLPPEDRTIGFVFQNYALFPHLSVKENIAYGISKLATEEREKRINETLSFLGIEALAQSKPSMLSGGEQQRVALARALVTQPKLLLLDEPLSALDVSTRSHVRTELKELLGKLSIPTIVVTHDYEDARVLADRVAVMDKGKIIQTGTPREIAQFPANHFVAEFTGTNLIAVETADSEISDYVAFDPWKVKVSRESKNSVLEWHGEICDMAVTGGFVRLHINGRSSFYADIPIETYEQMDFQIGEAIYACVGPKEVRTIKLEKDEGSPVEQKGIQRPEKNVKQLWKWGYTLVAILAITFLMFTYVFSSQRANGFTNESQIEMFSLVAANATDPFNKLIEEFENDHSNVNVEATYAGTQIIRTQLEQGAKADLFLSADLDHIEAVKQQGLISEFFPVSNNHLVIVIPKDNQVGIHSLKDLSSKKVKLVIGTDTVPIGKYTREVLEKAKVKYGEDFYEKVLANVVSFETNVKQVLQKVSLGEAEAGIVYTTDVTPEFLKKVKIIEIPKEYNIVATNYISVPNAAPNKNLAEEFMHMILSDKGQKTFLKYNYDPLSEDFQ